MAICCRSTSPLLLLFFQLGPDGSRCLHGCSQSHRAKKTSILSLSLSKVVAVSSLTFFAGWVPSALTVADNQVKPIRGQYGHLAKTLHKTCERGRECGTESKRKKKSFTDWLILNAASWAHVSNIFKFFMLCILMNNKDWFDLIWSDITCVQLHHFLTLWPVCVTDDWDSDCCCFCCILFPLCLEMVLG